jgi:quercetin dioxygenase-like cupin family protein
MRPKPLRSVLVLATLLTANFIYAKEKKNMSNTTIENTAMKVLTPASMPTSPGPAEYFTGSVKVTSLIQGEEPSCLQCAAVGFQPGARSAWHTHPKGQVLVVTEGAGLIQEWGKPVRKIKVGDVIWTPPNVKHWHGAAPDSAMSHTAIQESLDGKVVEWMEKVSDEQYQAIAK